MNKTIEVLVIENHTNVIHRSVSTVYADANPYNTAINALINELTGLANKQIKMATALATNPAKPVAVEMTVDELQAAIDKDFTPSKKTAPKFNIQQLPSIKMNEVLGGA